MVARPSITPSWTRSTTSSSTRPHPLIISGAAEDEPNVTAPSATRPDSNCAKSTRTYVVDFKAKTRRAHGARASPASSVRSTWATCSPATRAWRATWKPRSIAEVLEEIDRDYVVKDGRSHHHRRVHRPHDAGPPLEPRPPPGNRGQGGRPGQPTGDHLATLTFQNLFRLYENLAGMTGTAVTQAEEFAEIYKLDVVACRPTSR